MLPAMSEADHDRFALRAFTAAFPGFEETDPDEARTAELREMTMRSLVPPPKVALTIFDLVDNELVETDETAIPTN